MNGYRAAVSLLPSVWQIPLLSIAPSHMCRVQEIRLRAGQAVSFGIGGEEYFLTDKGVLTERRADGVLCEEHLLRQTVDRMLEYSVYAHQEELRRGFVTVGGCRVGIAGTAVAEDGCIVGYRAITSLCIRVARVHDGCAESLMRVLYDDQVHSALICSEPSGGKTSILRDLAHQFSRRRLSVTVIDERGELSGVDSLIGCDVLRYVPKAVGLEQAIRCLAPQAVLLDELGDTDELEAVCDGFLRGVPTIATVHAGTADLLCKRQGLYNLLERGIFDYLIFLHGRHAPGRIAQVLRTEEWLHERNRSVDTVADGIGDRHDGTTHSDKAYYFSVSL